MKKTLLAALIGSVIALSLGTAWAQPGPHGDGPQYRQQRRAYNIQHRIDVQEREIRNGIRTGALSRQEARILRDNISQIKREYKFAKRTDRYVSMEERARLDNMLDRNGRMIRRMENNGVTRF